MTKPINIKCQFCDFEGPHKEWLSKGDECPKCHGFYDWRLAQDSEE